MLCGLLGAIKTHSSEAISLLSDCTPRPFIHLPVVVQSPNNNNKHRLEFWPKTLKKNLKASFFKPCHNCYLANTCQFVWLGFLGLVFFCIFWIVAESSRYHVEEKQLWTQCPETRTYFLSAKGGGSCLITK